MRAAVLLPDRLDCVVNPLIGSLFQNVLDSNGKEKLFAQLRKIVNRQQSCRDSLVNMRHHADNTHGAL